MKLILGRVMTVLERLAASEKGRGVTELAHELRLPPSNVHRILRALLALDYVRQDTPQRTYSLTPRLFELGMALVGRIDLRVLARPELEMLSVASREEVGLAVLEQQDIVCIDHIQGRYAAQAQSIVGVRIPAFCTSAGRCLLALRADGLDVMRASVRTAFTERTVTDMRSLTSQLTLVRRNGYAVAVEEWHRRVSSVSAPIVDGTGNAIAALSVFGKSERVRSRLRDYAALLISATDAVSQRLRGGLPPRPRNMKPGQRGNA
jgi:DNA-binding IclR family transcriptional regulator